MKDTPYQDYFKRNHRKRLIGWVLFYSFLLFVFLVFFIKQISKVNTLQFATGQLQLTTSKIQYVSGDSINFTLTNNFNLPITLINKCPKPWLHVFNYNNGVWNQISSSTSASNCTSQASDLIINPHKSITENYDYWKSIFTNPGIYRIAILAENYPSISYADFQVIAKPVVLAAPSPVVIYKPVYTPVYVPQYTSSGGSDGGGGGGGGGDN